MLLQNAVTVADTMDRLIVNYAKYKNRYVSGMVRLSKVVIII
ncbi:hypothetical protein ALT785_830015 [Alteromonas infernus]